MYTDGSYNTATAVYGGAYFVEGVIEGSVSGDEPSLASARNVAGECLAVIRGLKDLVDKAQLTIGDTVIIYHDYTGLSAWADGSWKAKKDVAKRYQKSISLFQSKGLEISFQKVPAHSGIKENEYVDTLAKAAVGLQ